MNFCLLLLQKGPMWFNIEFFHTQAGDFTHYLAEADNWVIGVDKRLAHQAAVPKT